MLRYCPGMSDTHPGPRVYQMLGISVILLVLAGPISSLPSQPAVNNAGTPGTTSSGAGDSDPGYSDLILFGQVTYQSTWPWLAVVVDLTPHDIGFYTQYRCGGALVSLKHVLTAAHCIHPLNGTVLTPSQALVFVGKYRSDNFIGGGREVSAIHVHERFLGSGRRDHDIAIVELEEAVIPSRRVKPIRLWDTAAQVTSCVGTVVGWGADESGAPISRIPRQAPMLPVSYQECAASDPRFRNRLLTNVTFCAGFRNGTGPCTGDSGTGLVFPTLNSEGQTEWLLRGTVSRSLYNRDLMEPCDLSHYSIFTDLIMLGPWVRQHVLPREVKNSNPRQIGNNTVWQCSGETFVLAATNGNLTLVSQLLNASMNPDITNSEDRTALYEAARSGHVTVVRLLLERGAHVNKRSTDKGRAALHIAAKEGNLNTVKLLLNHSADVNARSAHKKTPLHEAAYWGRVSVVEELLTRGASVSAKDNNGRTPLHYTAHHSGSSSRVAQLLIESGAEIGARNKDRDTPLHLAASYGHADVIQVLLDKGAAINSRNSINATPLFLASWYGREGALRLLLDRGADVNITAALYQAARYGHVSVVRLLLEPGADVNKRNTDMRRSALHIAAAQGNLNIVKLLLNYHKDINARDAHDKTPLHEAAYWGRVSVMQELITQGAKVSVKTSIGDTPLHYSAHQSNGTVTQLLKDNGAEVGARNMYGYTSLHRASQYGNTNVMSVLIDSGADVNAMSKVNLTPLFLAARFGHVKAVRLLVERGADMNLRAVYGGTPLKIAARNKHTAVVEFLKSRGGEE